MAQYKIKDAEGNVLNTIIADLEFVESNYDFYELVVSNREPSTESVERNWRDKELDRTDKYMMVSDYPENARSAMATYRQTLRDWTSTEDFPNARPVFLDEPSNQNEAV